MEANVMIQLVLLAVLPCVMEGLKKISWVDSNKSWVCPLLCIAASVLTAWTMKLPNWFVVGILTGAATNKVYDWVHNSGKVAAVLLLAFAMALLSGCQEVANVQSRLTITYVPETGQISYERVGDIEVNDCIITKDPNGVQIAFTQAKATDATAQVVAKEFSAVAQKLVDKIPDNALDAAAGL